MQKIEKRWSFISSGCGMRRFTFEESRKQEEKAWGGEKEKRETEGEEEGDRERRERERSRKRR